LEPLEYTPVGTADHCHIAQGACFGGDTKVGEFDKTFLGGKDVGTFDISVNDTLFV
jgi:hypothetical protein